MKPHSPHLFDFSSFMLNSVLPHRGQCLKRCSGCCMCIFVFLYVLCHGYPQFTANIRLFQLCFLTLRAYLYKINEDDIRATPRSYERISKSYAIYKERKDTISKNVFMNIIKGNVGRVIAEEFVSFIEADHKPLISYDEVFSGEDLSIEIIDRIKEESHTRLYLSAMNILKVLESNIEKENDTVNIERFIKFLKEYPIDLMVGIMKDIKNNYQKVYSIAIANKEFIEAYFLAYSEVRG